MKIRNIKRVLITTMTICVMSVMTVFAATYTIADPTITVTASETKVNMKIDMSMNSVPDACLALNVTPYYSLRGSAALTADSTKGISSYSGRVTQLRGSVNYSYAVDSHRTYKKYIQKGYVLVSGTYNQVAAKTTYVN